MLAEDNDLEAYSRLFDIYYSKLQELYTPTIPDQPQLIEDLIQEVFMQVWTKSKTYNPEFGEVGKWIFTLADSTRIKHIQETSTLVENYSEALHVLTTEPDEDSSPFQFIEQQELKLSIEQKLLSLPKEQADVIQKTFLEGKSHSQAASELNIPTGTLKSRLRLAFFKLGSMLKDERMTKEKGD